MTLEYNSTSLTEANNTMAYLHSGNLQSPDAIEQLFGAIRITVSDGGILHLNVSRCSFMQPRAILALISAARLWHRLTGHPVVLTNIDNRVHPYLERMDLFQVCRDFLIEQKELAKSRRFDRSPDSNKLLEVLPLPSDEDANVEAVTDGMRRAGQIMRSWIDDENRIQSALTLLSEIGQNIVHSEDVGYAIVQRYKQPYSENAELASEIHVAIADLGIGIQASLLHNNSSLKTKFEQGSDFILHALEQGVSGRAETRGIGLYQVRELVRKWQGTLTIRSDTSSLHIEDENIEIQDRLTYVPGVQVSVIVRGRAEIW